jgi:hypothetical protein
LAAFTVIRSCAGPYMSAGRIGLWNCGEPR